MYIPHYYKNENIEEVKDFIKQNSFGILLSTNEGKIIGSHIPLELEMDQNGNEVLYGHVSKANKQWRSFSEATEILCIFQGPHSYVSSSWYEIEEVPTWNYISVHIYGTLQMIEEEELRYSLNLLVNKYERNVEKPIRLSELSDKTMKQVKGIVGFKISINEIQAAYKLSQTRSEKDYDEIVHKLSESEGALEKETSKLMKKRKPPAF